MGKSKEIIATPPQQSSVESFIGQAIALNAPVETMERLFDLRAKVKAEMATEEFTAALAAFQAACPIIEKKKPVLNKDGKTVRYKYAPIDSIVDQIKKPLAANGFSYTWTVENTPTAITAIAKITHKLGHSETSSFTIPVDTEGYMTAPQKVASALTFAKRYALCNALGIMTGEEDTDATDVNKESDAKSVKAKITLRLRTLGKPTETKEQVEEAVKKLTGIALEEKNYEEIASRLQDIIDENHEDHTIQG
jgi:ERF superfamily